MTNVYGASDLRTADTNRGSAKNPSVRAHTHARSHTIPPKIARTRFTEFSDFSTQPGTWLKSTRRKRQVRENWLAASLHLITACPRTVLAGSPLSNPACLAASETLLSGSLGSACRRPRSHPCAPPGVTTSLSTTRCAQTNRTPYWPNKAALMGWSRFGQEGQSGIPSPVPKQCPE